MERAYKALKAFILDELNARLAQWEDDKAQLPLLTEETVRFGVVDPMKTAGDTLCAIFPESLDEEDGEISGAGLVSLSVTVCFLCRAALYDELLLRMSRYAACFRSCVRADGSLKGAAKDALIKTINYLPDTGVADRQAAVCEIEMSIIFEEE